MKDADDVRHHFLGWLLEAQMDVIDNLNVFSYNQVYYAQQIINRIFETTGRIKQIYSSLDTFDKDLHRDIYSYDDMPHLDYNPEDKTLSFKAPTGYTERGPRPFYGNPRKMALDRWGNRRFIRRRKDGTYMKNVDVGRSLAMDRRRQSQTWAPAGFRDQGDGSPSLLVRLLDMFRGVDEEVLMAESYLMCADCDNYSSECGCHNSESDAYIYAYNDGHTDARRDGSYRPSTTDREITSFKKIFKQAEDEYEYDPSMPSDTWGDDIVGYEDIPNIIYGRYFHEGVSVPEEVWNRNKEDDASSITEDDAEPEDGFPNEEIERFLALSGMSDDDGEPLWNISDLNDEQYELLDVFLNYENIRYVDLDIILDGLTLLQTPEDFLPNDGMKLRMQESRDNFLKLLKVCQENDGIIDSSHPAEAYIIAIECGIAIHN